jgi:hypothetical protein
MPDFGKLINKAKEMAGQHPDQVSKGLEKAEDLVDKKTGGQYHNQVENAGHAAANYLGAQDQDRPGGQQQGGPQQGNQQQGGPQGQNQNPNQQGYDQNQR